ncbi:MAG: hypothetical protein AAF583_08130 [Pseudomonadota bacterium]
MDMLQTKQATQQDTRFFRLFSWVILAFVIIAFGGKAVFNTDSLPPITSMHHFHAISMMGWFVLFAVQTTLMDTSRNNLHRILGGLSLLLVITFIIFSGLISKLNWAREGEPLILTSNLVNITMFLGFYITGILQRRNTATHRRLMAFATISFLGPAAARIPEIFDASVFLSLPILLAFMFTPLIHDRFIKRKTYGVTIIGTGLLLSMIPVNLTLSGLPAWVSLLETVFGKGGLGG